MYFPNRWRSLLATLLVLVVGAAGLDSTPAGAEEGIHMLDISNVTGPEANAGTTSFAFEVSLSLPALNDVLVDFRTVDGTAQSTTIGTSSPDYTSTSGTLRFVPGDTSETVVVNVLGDTQPEPIERFHLILENARNATIRDGDGLGSITNEDAAPVTIAIGNASVSESAGTATFTITQSETSAQDTRVAYATTNGTASAGSDYTAKTGVATIAAGSTSTTVVISILGDAVDEADETYTVNLAEASNAGVTDSSGLGTIVDDEGVPTVSIADQPAIAEGANGTFTVSISGASDRDVVVQYTTQNGTATAGQDYSAASGSVTFPRNTTASRTITIASTQDALDEPDETLKVVLSSPTNATCGDCEGLGTIVDDENTPVIRVANDTATEGTDTSLQFIVTLEGVSGGTVTVQYATSDGTAKQPGDYTAAAGTLTFASGETEKTVSVPVNNDTVDEADTETLTITLSAPVGATCTGGHCIADGTIADNDATPTVAVSGGSGSEPSTPVPFTITLSAAADRDLAVDYATGAAAGGLPDATAGSDYTTTNGSVTFTAGETTKTVNVPVLDDVAVEGSEDLALTVGGTGISCTAGDCDAAGTILDNESPKLSINDGAVTEGNGASTRQIVFTVSTSTTSTNPITFRYDTVEGTADAGEDYTGVANGLGTILPNQASTTITIDVLPDSFAEPTEFFTVVLSNAIGAFIQDGEGVGTITDNDGGTPSSLAVADSSVVEGTGGTSTLTFTITRTPSNPLTTQTVRVDYATRDLSTPEATAGIDYTARTGTLTFVAGDNSETVNITVTGDSIDEISERFELVLSGAANATISDTVGVGTITDDDGPTISVVDAGSASEATGSMTFLVRLSAPSPQVVTVQSATADGTAVAPGDYTARAATTLTFPVGSVEQAFVVTLQDDATDEVDENLAVNLSAPTNASIADGNAVGTITDDDGPTVSVNDPTGVTEDEGAAVTFLVTLSAPSVQTVTVKVISTDGTGTAPNDYTAMPSTTVTFTPGDVEEPVTVTLKEDALDEVNETFGLQLSEPTNASILDGTGVATINDDDLTPTLSVNDLSVGEVDPSSTSTANFVVTLSSVSGRDVTVQAATITGGTATADVDYTARTATLSIPAGSTQAAFDVTVLADEVDEPDETVLVQLSGPDAATVADADGVATITDDDVPPSIAIADISVVEGTGTTTTATFKVTLSEPSARTVKVVATTANGSAVAPGDYTAASATLTYVPGDVSEDFVVAIAADAVDEPDEAFAVNLTGADQATIDDAAAVGTITDDDGAPTLSINDVAAAEGNSGTKTVTFTVTQSAASAQNVTVNFATAAGTATAGTDYRSNSGTVTIPAGQTSATIGVDFVGDTTDEADETFSVNLSGATNATIAKATGAGTITDDDQPATTPAAGPQGYSLVGEDGSLYAFGTAKNLGDMRGQRLNAPIIGVAYTPGGNGYWLVARDGGIFTFGDAEFFGSMGDQRLNSPVIGMAATPTGKGYWLFAGDGGIFTFGDAEFFGSMGDKNLNAPVINMEPLASGRGYWLVAADGGIFTFGLGDFFGSMGDQRLNQPVFDMTSTDSDRGYWLVARDGGIFSFGDAEAKFFGSAVNETPRPTRVIGMDSTPGSQGYWIADASGKVYRYGDAQDLGDRFGQANPAPMVAFATVPSLKP